MNYLDLVKRLAQESGSTNSPPTTTQNASGEVRRFCDWINAAWVDLQSLHTDWLWMRSTFSFDALVGDYEYSATDAGTGTTFANWHLNTLRSHLKSTGVGSQLFMRPWPYAAFRDYYLYSNRTDSRSQPIDCAVAPTKTLLLGPVPNDTYVIIGEYQKIPTELSADADIPGLPSQFQMILVWGALMHYGVYEAAPEAYQHGEANYNKLLTRLRIDQLPSIELAGGLV